MATATILQTPILSTSKNWLKEYKERKGLENFGEAITHLIDEFVELKAHVAFLEED